MLSRCVTVVAFVVYFKTGCLDSTQACPTLTKVRRGGGIVARPVRRVACRPLPRRQRWCHRPSCEAEGTSPAPTENQSDTANAQLGGKCGSTSKRANRQLLTQGNARRKRHRGSREPRWRRCERSSGRKGGGGAFPGVWPQQTLSCESTCHTEDETRPFPGGLML